MSKKRKTLRERVSTSMLASLAWPGGAAPAEKWLWQLDHWQAFVRRERRAAVAEYKRRKEKEG